MHTIRRSIAALAVLGTLLGATGVAAAGHTGYVCTVNYNQVPGSAGSYGYLRVTLYKNSTCSGYVGTVTWCSEGASSSICATNAAFHFKPDALLVTYQMLVKALAEGLQIHAETEVGSDTRGRAIYFYGF